MLLSNETLIYYGPGAAAVSEPCIATAVANIKAFGKGTAALAGAGIIPAAHVTGLKNSPTYPQGAGSVITALPKAKGRFGASIKVNQLSQDDVTGAVLEARVEGGAVTKRGSQTTLSIRRR